MMFYYFWNLLSASFISKIDSGSAWCEKWHVSDTEKYAIGKYLPLENISLQMSLHPFFFFHNNKMRWENINCVYIYKQKTCSTFPLGDPGKRGSQQIPLGNLVFLIKYLCQIANTNQKVFKHRTQKRESTIDRIYTICKK